MWQKYLGYRSTISTHALREEGDDLDNVWDHCATRFLPTPSARRATGGKCKMSIRYKISTHALREEGDYKISCGICGGD